MADEERERFDLRAEAEWLIRVRAMAKKLGMGASAYIRQATTRQLERDEVEFPERSSVNKKHQKGVDDGSNRKAPPKE